MNSKPDNESSKSPTFARRKVLQIGAATGILVAAYYLGFGQHSGQIKAVRHSQEMMGTIVNMTVCGPDEDRCRDIISACTSRMEVLSSMMSTYISDSPLSRLNRDGILENAPPELIEVFTISQEVSQLTDGAFDPTIKPLLSIYKAVKKTGKIPPREQIDKLLKLVDYNHIVIEKDNTIRYTEPGTQVTLGGIAKGYIVDQGVKVLKENGFHNANVEAGGDLVAIGTRQDGKPWKIGIRNPRSEDLRKMDTIELTNRAIATSGDYMQYFTDDRKVHHIINPKTGFSPVNTASSSILAPTLVWADALATATMVLGPDAATKLVESLTDCEGYFFDKKLTKYHTSGFFS